MELLLYVLMCVVRLVVVVSLVLGQSVNARLHLFVSWIKGGHYIPRDTKVQGLRIRCIIIYYFCV